MSFPAIFQKVTSLITTIKSKANYKGEKKQVEK